MSTVKIWSVEGNRQWLDGGAMFGNAPRTVWEKWIKPDEKSRIPLSCRCLLIEIEGKKILCETGIGAFFDPSLASRYGVENPDRHELKIHLHELGISPEDIDFVILSHLHFDHAGGLLKTFAEAAETGQGLIFPNAQFILGQQAWDRALHPHARDRASFIPELTKLLSESGRLKIVPRDPLPSPLKEHFEFIETNGHTPGQIHTLCKGPHRSVFFCGDLVPGQAWLHLPITMGYDRFPELLIDEKSKVYQRAVSENWLLFFTHDPLIAAAGVKKSESGKFEPTQPLPVLAGFEL